MKYQGNKPSNKRPEWGLTWLAYSYLSHLFYFFIFKTGKWLKLFFILLLSILLMKPELDMGIAVKYTARIAQGVEGTGAAGSLVQCSMFFSAHIRKKPDTACA